MWSGVIRSNPEYGQESPGGLRQGCEILRRQRRWAWRGECPGDCGLHSLAGQGQDGVAGWCMLAVSDRSMRSYRLASVHNCSH